MSYSQKEAQTDHKQWRLIKSQLLSKKFLIDLNLEKTDPPGLFFDSDIKKYYKRENFPSTIKNIVKEKTALLVKSIWQKKQYVAKKVDGSNGKKVKRHTRSKQVVFRIWPIDNAKYSKFGDITY